MTLALSFAAIVLVLAYFERRDQRRQLAEMDVARAWQHRHVRNAFVTQRPNRRRP